MRTTRSLLGGMRPRLLTLRRLSYSFAIPRNHYPNPPPIRILLTTLSAPSQPRSCHPKSRQVILPPPLCGVGNHKAACDPSSLGDPDGLAGVSPQRMTESLNINGILSISILRTEAGSSLEPLAPSPEVGWSSWYIYEMKVLTSDMLFQWRCC